MRIPDSMRQRARWLLQKPLFWLILVSTIVSAAYMFGAIGPAAKPYFVGDYVPALMLASGRGFTQPEPALANPAFDAFLANNTNSFDLNALPPDLKTIQPGSYAYIHYYMLHLIGCAWRIFGVNWTVYRLILIGFYIITAIAAYGVFRIGLRTRIALVCALIFATSPGVVYNLISLRDFSKATFILAIICILGNFVKGAFRGWRFYAAAAALGLTLGIGLGFREDLQIWPLICAFFLLMSSRWNGRDIARHGAAILIMAALFLASAMPILIKLPGYYAAFHHVTMGLATVHDDFLGLTRASYERNQKLGDDWAWAAYTLYGARTAGIYHGGGSYGPLQGQCAQKFAVAMATTFPADMLLRTYASTRWALQGARADVDHFMRSYVSDDHSLIQLLVKTRWPLTIFLEYSGVCLAVIALLLLAARSLRYALFALMLVYLLCAYVTAQYQYRHMFHHTIISLWLCGFVLENVLHPKTGKPLNPLALWRERRLPAWPTTLRVMSIALLALVGPWAALTAFRTYQDHSVNRLAERYRHAQLDSVDVTQQQMQHWTLFRCGTHTVSVNAATSPRAVPFQSEYLVVKLAASPERQQIWLRYESNGFYDFSVQYIVNPTGAPGTGSAFLFFPIYEHAASLEDGNYTYFAGVALPSEDAATFQGLYRVRNTTDFPLLLAWTQPADPALFKPHQEFSSKPECQCLAQLYNACSMDDPSPIRRDAEGMLASHQYEEARTRCLNGIVNNPQNCELLYTLGAVEAAAGNKEAARGHYHEAIAVHPASEIAYGGLQALYPAPEDIPALIALWRGLLEQQPNAYLAHAYLAKAHLRASADAEALAELNTAAQLCPGRTDLLAQKALLETRLGLYQPARASESLALRTDPHNVKTYLNLLDGYESLGAIWQAQEIALQGFITFPDNGLLQSRLREHVTRANDPARTCEIWNILQGNNLGSVLQEYVLQRPSP